MPTKYKISTPHQLTEYVRALRKTRGETQADVARKLGVSTMRVAAMERDLGRVSVHRLITLLHLLGAHLEFAIPELGQPLKAADQVAAQTDKSEATAESDLKRAGEW